MITINLSDEVLTDVTPRITVYTKSTWNDDFVANPYFMVQESRWSTAPSVSSATLQYRFGSVRLPGRISAQTVQPLTARGYWVLIQYSVNFQEDVWWLGYADSPITIQRYRGDSGGVQEVPCWGMERAMQYGQINTVVHKNPDPESDNLWLRKEQPTFFNPNRPGNRTKDSIAISNDVSRNVFCNPGEAEPAFWSTREIFKHLTSFHLPTNDYGVGTVPFTAHADAEYLPDWDNISLNTEGMSMHEALSHLLSEDRLLGWYLEPVVQFNWFNQLPTVTSVYIRPFTSTASALTLPSIGNLPANANTITWYDTGDDLTDSELQLDDSEQVDQVIVRGPREIAVGTFDSAVEWVKDWDDEDIEEEGEDTIPSLETQYSESYKDHESWAGLNMLQKRELNDYFRSQQRFRDVFSRYKIDDTWNGKCGEANLFVMNGETVYLPYLGSVELLPELPLFCDVKYEDTAASAVDETRGRQPLPIIAVVKNPASDKYKPLQDVHSAYGTPAVRNPNRLDYQVSVTTENVPGPAFRMNISGAPQHALFRSFVGNDADPEKLNPKVWGEHSIDNIRITAAMRGGRRPQYAIPTTVTSDLARRRIITLEHPGLQHVYIAAGTVLGVNADSELLTSPGGVLRDPSAIIQALCTIAAKNLSSPRRQLHIQTGRMVTGAKVGRMITTHNGTTAETVIREIIISSPIVEDDSPPPVTTTILAANSQANIASLVGRVPEPEVLQ